MHVEMDDTVREIGPLRIACVRGLPTDAAFTAAMRRVLGAELPLRVGQATEAHGAWTLCVGPSEWLVLAEGDMDPTASLRGQLRGFAAVIDVSVAYTGFALRGLRAERLLRKGCALDLDPAVFLPRRCARTVFARVPVILLRRSDDDEFWILASASYAGWLSEWFADAQLG